GCVSRFPGGATCWGGEPRARGDQDGDPLSPRPRSGRRGGPTPSARWWGARRGLGRRRGGPPRGQAPRRSGSLLRQRGPRATRRRRAVGGATGPGRTPVVQAVVPLRRPALAAGRSHLAGAASRALAGPQPYVGPPLQRGCRLGARQVGVSLVR